jgi:hypothetical protein
MYHNHHHHHHYYHYRIANGNQRETGNINLGFVFVIISHQPERFRGVVDKVYVVSDGTYSEVDKGAFMDEMVRGLL